MSSRADWSTERAAWTVEVERTGAAGTLRLGCGLLVMCSGYYRYDAGHAPALPGAESFAGRIVHPQQWTDDIEVAGKRIVVIGSGATAVTLVPALAKSAARVTMLQRSPTWMLSRPSEDRLARGLRRLLPLGIANAAMRWQRVLLGMYFFALCRNRPARAKRLLLGGVRAWMGREHALEPDFTPRYDPWRQRLCLVPDGDLFRALRGGRAAIATGEIERLDAGRCPPRRRRVARRRPDRHRHRADAGGLRRRRDQRRRPAGRLAGDAQLQGGDVQRRAQPGLGVRLQQRLVDPEVGPDLGVRLPPARATCGEAACARRRRATTIPQIAGAPWFDLSSGYVQRSLHLLPQQGSRPPWRLHQNYLRDLVALRWGRVDDGVLVFSNPGPPGDAGDGRKRGGRRLKSALSPRRDPLSMSLKCGIVGLPNVGKSTLFNALTKAGIAAENYPFCTIEPNVGVVELPDARLGQLAAIVKPERIVPAIVEFVDIAGLVAGASKGEGLGNQFLAHIRETDAIVNVVRCFEDDERDPRRRQGRPGVRHRGDPDRALPRRPGHRREDARPLGQGGQVGQRQGSQAPGRRAREVQSRPSTRPGRCAPSPSARKSRRC